MAYQFIEHGRWEPYTPTEPLPGRLSTIPMSALFFRRIGDGVDWYIYANTRSNWQADACVATCLPTGVEDGAYIMQAITRTPEMILPGISLVLEILGVDPADDKPHRIFEQKIYRSADGGSVSEKDTLPRPDAKSIDSTSGKIILARTPAPGGNGTMYAAVDAMIESGSDVELKLWWGGAKTWIIDNQNMLNMAGALQISPGVLQEMFNAADQLETG